MSDLRTFPRRSASALALALACAPAFAQGGDQDGAQAEVNAAAERAANVEASAATADLPDAVVELRAACKVLSALAREIDRQRRAEVAAEEAPEEARESDSTRALRERASLSEARVRGSVRALARSLDRPARYVAWLKREPSALVLSRGARAVELYCARPRDAQPLSPLVDALRDRLLATPRVPGLQRALLAIPGPRVRSALSAIAAKHPSFLRLALRRPDAELLSSTCERALGAQAAARVALAALRGTQLNALDFDDLDERARHAAVLRRACELLEQRREPPLQAALAVFVAKLASVPAKAADEDVLAEVQAARERYQEDAFASITHAHLRAESLRAKAYLSHALASLASEEAGEYLLDELEGDVEPGLVAPLIRALGLMRYRPAVPRILERWEPRTERVCQSALASISGRRFRTAGSWRTWWQGQLQAEAERATAQVAEASQ